ncbi:MAG: OFA family MFS transporter [Planctomycetaceae bacterium]
MPPAALAIHLCIGMAYGFSVFWLPLSKAVGIRRAVECPSSMGILAPVAVECDWKVSDLGWLYTLFFVILGSSAALWGRWLERVGPRKAGVVAAVCWCGGLCISAVGVRLHQLWLLWLGSGVIGGIGLGLGYISPVSTLLKWFPDRRGLATGMAIMGFGGGAMIGAPLADLLMKYFATPESVGVWETLCALAAIYFVFMLSGALGYRLPPAGWQPPAGWPAGSTTSGSRYVSVDVAWRTPQFWLLWGALCVNVTAGIGILGMASPLLQEVFGGRLIGVSGSMHDLTDEQKVAMTAIAAGFTGLLSLFNIAGRFFWASLSDYLGRHATYTVFFTLGIALYVAAAWATEQADLGAFVAAFCVVLSMYGGGFATVPAYLADLFGARMVSAIHGRLLTAWSTAGVLGPVLVNYLREYQLERGAGTAAAYSVTMYVLAALLAVGLICNWRIRPVADRLFVDGDDVAAPERAADATHHQTSSVGTMGLLAAAWMAVLGPLAWGVWMTLQKTVLLLR